MSGRPIKCVVVGDGTGKAVHWKAEFAANNDFKQIFSGQDMYAYIANNRQFSLRICSDSKLKDSLIGSLWWLLLLIRRYSTIIQHQWSLTAYKFLWDFGVWE